MSSATEFSLSVIAAVVVALAILFVVNKISPIAYFKTRTGKGIAKGIILAIIFAVGLALLAGCSGSYFNDASVFAGLDYTKNDSPMCESRGPDPNTTSNLGLRGNLYESEDGRYRANAKYTHHSCAFNEDDRAYDAVGVELEYRLWAR